MIELDTRQLERTPEDLDTLADEVFTECCDEEDPGRIIRQTLERVGDKWSVLTIGSLRNGPLRFSELRRNVSGISQRMLTRTVRALERDGLVTRTVYPEIPPRVEYELTELGRTLISPVLSLAEWAMNNAERIDSNRARFDEKAGVAR
jgi:DNA-binding HxlR family transcriptional regulator